MNAKGNALKSRLYYKEAVKIEDISFCIFCYWIPRSYPVSDTKQLLILFTGAPRKEKERKKNFNKKSYLYIFYFILYHIFYF